MNEAASSGAFEESEKTHPDVITIMTDAQSTLLIYRYEGCVTCTVLYNSWYVVQQSAVRYLSFIKPVMFFVVVVCKSVFLGLILVKMQHLRGRFRC